MEKNMNNEMDDKHDYLLVHGGNQLKGTVKIEGAKNAVLPILAASLLAENGVTVLKNVPVISDVINMIDIIKDLGVTVNFNKDLNEVTINAVKRLKVDTNDELVRQMRASVLVMGPLLSREKRAKVVIPGGCVIGKRPIDIHLKGFEELGATIVQENEYIDAVTEELRGHNIHLEFPSVGATQNIIMAAVLAKGNTIINNAAKEIEVADLVDFLNKMGANIIGAGTESIQIKGVSDLKGVEHTIVQDRIEAGTFMIAAAMTEGNVLIKGAISKHNQPLITILTEMGAVIRDEEDGTRVIGPRIIKPANIITKPFPGFPTDLQAQITSMLTFADGISIVAETVFENRFQHLKELQKMKADVLILGNIAIIKGTEDLKGTTVEATDLRAAAALILAGLKAKGTTKVYNVKYLDRGYYKFHEKLQKLGAKVERVNEVNKKNI